MSGNHIRANSISIDKTINPRSDAEFVTASQSGDKRGLDTSVVIDQSAENGTIPLLMSIENILLRIEEQLQFITDQRG